MDLKGTYVLIEEYDDGEKSVNLMTARQIVNRVDCYDFLPVIEYRIYEAGISGVREIKYTGWQPGCLLEFVYADNGTRAFSGYGTDH